MAGPAVERVVLKAIIWAFLFSMLTSCGDAPNSQPKLEPAKAYPHWMVTSMSECLPMNEAERAQSELVLEVLGTFSTMSDWMNIAAVKHFGRDRFRKIDKKTTPLCPPTSLLPEVARVTLSQGVFDRPHLFIDELRLARVLGPRDPRIIDAVARTAFFKFPIHNGMNGTMVRDIRSIARVVLAEFGRDAAKPWGQQAFDLMSPDDSLGTGAAQLAVAAGYLGALERASGLMSAMLEQHPDDPIPRNVRDRLFELAYAIGYGGDEARNFAGPIFVLLQRKVASWTTLLMELELPPERMCLVLERIGGQEVERELSKEPCAAERRVYTQ